MTSVTVLTVNADQDEYTEADYAEMFAELRAGKSLDKFCTLVGSAFSKAAWNNWERGEGKLSRKMRSELRVGVGRPPLPPTVAEAIAVAHPDAEVVRVTEDGEEIRRIILTGLEPMSLCLNGQVTVRGSSTGTRTDHRFRPTVSPDNQAWLKEQGLGINEAIELLRKELNHERP